MRILKHMVWPIRPFFLFGIFRMARSAAVRSTSSVELRGIIIPLWKNPTFPTPIFLVRVALTHLQFCIKILDLVYLPTLRTKLNDKMIKQPVIRMRGSSDARPPVYALGGSVTGIVSCGTDGGSTLRNPSTNRSMNSWYL